MRRRPALALASAAVLLASVGVASAATQRAVPTVPVSPTVPATGADVISDNVTHVGTVPLDGAAVSMKVVKVGEQVRAYVSGAGGLSIYDATDPAAPVLLGHLPIYNWENEDIAVSADGKTAVLTEFEGLLYLHVVDTSDPTLPRVTGTLALSGDHTVVCADAPCNYLYGSEGTTYDITDRAAPKELPKAQSWRTLTGASSGHNLHQDAAGVWVADTKPLVVFEQVDGDPLNLRVLTTGTITKNTNYQHNNIRPRAEQYKRRGKSEPASGNLRPGELLLGNGESNFTGRCSASSGAFSTWSMVGFDRGVPMQQLEVLRPVSGTYANGDPAVNGLGCSGHWFTEKDAQDGSILVAAAWYEHGTRFLKVDPKTGGIRQVGFYQPLRGSTSQTYWIPGTDYAWAIDYHSGIDILKFDETKPAPSTAAIDASWLAKATVKDPLSELLRGVCQAGQLTPGQHAALQQLRRDGSNAAALLAGPLAGLRARQ